MNEFDISFEPPAPPAAPSPAAASPVATVPDFSAAIGQLTATSVPVDPAAGVAAPAASGPSQAGGLDPAAFYDPKVLKFAEHLTGKYETPEAMEAKLAESSVQDAVAEALAAVDEQWRPTALALKQQYEEGLITDEVYQQLSGAFNVQYNAARSQAEALAKMKPVYESVQTQQQERARQAQIDAQVAAAVQAQPSLKGAEHLLRNSIVAGEAPHVAAASVLAFVRNQQPAPTLPANIATGMPVTSRPAGSQQPGVNIPDPLTDPAGWAAFERQLMATHGNGAYPG